ncbi:hypothetical protein D3OALGA1CA_5250 [Olavius algarvensis associated proteobacterium Delta 3]|nr:hypothetical protein D3OALGB2SA_549 [Olavius algarvensis associated proteobacterium Delta 3]CAB5164041.1 hypothetical protein D3OALGA1CA_5250 [Olavius algarvensis associated proteobacterium Delta 3]
MPAHAGIQKCHLTKACLRDPVRYDSHWGEKLPRLPNFLEKRA